MTCLQACAAMRQLGELEFVLALVVFDRDLTRVAGDGHDQVLAGTDALLDSRTDGLLQTVEENLLGDVLVAVDDVDHPQEVFSVHREELRLAGWDGGAVVE